MKVRIDGYEIDCSVDEFSQLRAATTVAAKPTHRHPPISLEALEPRHIPNVTSSIHPPTFNDTTKRGVVIRGIKSLVVGTVGRYGKQGLTIHQIVTLSSLSLREVKNGIYSAMDRFQGPPLLTLTDQALYFCTEVGESYAIACEFGAKKIIRKEEYLKSSEAAR